MSNLEHLISDNEDKRKQAVEYLDSTADSNPQGLIPDLDKLLQYIVQAKDDLTKLRIARAVAEISNVNSAEILSKRDLMFTALSKLSNEPLQEDGGHKLSTAVYLMTSLQPLFTTNPDLVKQFIPVLLSLMGKPSSIKWSAYSPIATLAATNPLVLGGNVGELLDVVVDFPQLLLVLPNLYQLDKEAFASRVSILVEIYTKDPSMQSSILQIMLEISKSDSEAMIAHLPLFSSGLMAPTTGYSVAMIMAEVSHNNPQAIYPYVGQLMTAMTIVNGLNMQIPNILGLIGNHSIEYAKEMMDKLFSMLNIPDQNVKSAVLIEIRNLTEMDKTLVESNLDLIRSMTDDPQETIRDQANHIINIVEGRDVTSLAKLIEEQNQKIEEVVKSIDDLRVYVDENIDMLKEFIAEVAKKLPIPGSFSTEGRIRKTLILHFNCGTQSDRCLYPEDRTFTTETKTWNRWLKIAFSAVNVGKSLLLPVSGGGAIGSVKKAYEDYKNKDDKDFLEFIKQPFLTSEEQDTLVNQLNDAQFFNVFIYDGKSTNWNCIMCNPQSI